jgi:hypothetical protein
MAAVLKHSQQGGSRLLVLLLVAYSANPQGEWRIDLATFAGLARLHRRRLLQILQQLTADQELEIRPGGGRGHHSTYRLRLGENSAETCTVSPGATPSETVQDPAPFSEKGEATCTLSAQKGAAECTLSTLKGAAECTLSAPPCPPFPPHPQSPLNPPKKQDPSSLPPDSSEPFSPLPEPRSLSAPQSAVFRVNLLLEDAGVPLPTPAQIGHWSKTLGGLEPLLELLGRLIHAGLANKREPIVYAHRVVMERAARPEPARAANLLRTAGVDDKRREQAARIAGKRGGA